MSSGKTSSQSSVSGEARRWAPILVAAVALLVALRTTSGALTVLLVIIVLGLLLERFLDRRSPSVSQNRHRSEGSSPPERRRLC